MDMSKVKVSLSHGENLRRKSAGHAPNLHVTPDICFTTEGKARKNRSQGSRKVSVGHDSVCSHCRLAGSKDK